MLRPREAAPSPARSSSGSHPLGRGRRALERVQQRCLQLLQVRADEGLAGGMGSSTHLLQHPVRLLLHAALLALRGQPAAPPSGWPLGTASPCAPVLQHGCGVEARTRRPPADLQGRLDGAVQGAQGLLVGVGSHCHHQIQEGEPGAERGEQVGSCRVTSTPRPHWDSAFESHLMHGSGRSYTGQPGCPQCCSIPW